MISRPLDIENPAQLVAYLRQLGRIASGEHPQMSVLSGGVSNRTVLVRQADGQEWVIKQALAKLRTQADWFSDPARSHREALGIRWLGELAPRGTIPSLIFQDPAQHVLAMQAVPRPHENWKAILLAGIVRTEDIEQFARLLAEVHARSSARRDELEPIFRDRSFFESLRVEPYYLYSAERVPEARDFLAALVDATRRRQLALVHGDYSPKNVLVHAGRLVLLDHEVIHWGDPGFDMGFSMAHLLSKLHHLPAHREQFRGAAQGYWRAYFDRAAPALADVELEDMSIRHTLGCTLARVAGRSPLEYLSAHEQARQRDVVISLMSDPPNTMAGLIDRFASEI